MQKGPTQLCRQGPLTPLPRPGGREWGRHPQLNLPTLWGSDGHPRLTHEKQRLRDAEEHTRGCPAGWGSAGIETVRLQSQGGFPNHPSRHLAVT